MTPTVPSRGESRWPRLGAIVVVTVAAVIAVMRWLGLQPLDSSSRVNPRTVLQAVTPTSETSWGVLVKPPAEWPTPHAWKTGAEVAEWFRLVMDPGMKWDQYYVQRAYRKDIEEMRRPDWGALIEPSSTEQALRYDGYYRQVFWFLGFKSAEPFGQGVLRRAAQMDPQDSGADRLSTKGYALIDLEGNVDAVGTLDEENGQGGFTHFEVFWDIDDIASLPEAP
jgi:hypothetical protein